MPNNERVSRRGFLRMATGAGVVAGAVIVGADRFLPRAISDVKAAGTGEPSMSPAICAEPSFATGATEAPKDLTDLGVMVRVPLSIEDTAGGMKSVTLDQAPTSTWFHRVYNPELFNRENNWGGADSWGVSLMGAFDGAHFEEFGNPGEVRVQVDEGADHATLRVGAMTSGSHIDDYKWGTRDGHKRVQMKGKNVGMWLRTQPGAAIAVVDPDTGLPYMDANGLAIAIVANDRGDAGIILPNNGRVEAVWQVTDPTLGSFESVVWFGPDDDPKSDLRINKVDLSQIAAKPAIAGQD